MQTSVRTGGTLMEITEGEREIIKVLSYLSHEQKEYVITYLKGLLADQETSFPDQVTTDAPF